MATGRGVLRTESRGLLALIPAHDEAPRIGAVVRGALPYLPVLVVDDGSVDATATEAAAAGAVVLSQHPNQGKGAALRAGFARALTDGALAVVTLDADGQHDPAELPRFIEAESAQSSELIVGRRDFGRMPLVRRASNWAGAVLLSAAVGRWIPDNQSGYRLIGRRLMTAMLNSHEDGFAFEVEMIAVCLREGWAVRWVPISTIYGDERSHIRPLHHLREFIGVAWRARKIARSGAQS
ncbi:MAG: glycosyltransferase family 2 protein [Chloroflexi bacterium]|nr:glycosyltransferase family 2 protein [Chloroflexota bacterium]